MYCEAVGNTRILDEEIFMEWEKRRMSVRSVIQWMMQSLGSGIHFVEWNAPSIDISFTKCSAMQCNAVIETVSLMIGAYEGRRL